MKESSKKKPIFNQYEKYETGTRNEILNLAIELGLKYRIESIKVCEVKTVEDKRYIEALETELKDFKRAISQI